LPILANKKNHLPDFARVVPTPAQVEPILTVQFNQQRMSRVAIHECRNNRNLINAGSVDSLPHPTGKVGVPREDGNDAGGFGQLLLNIHFPGWCAGHQGFIRPYIDTIPPQRITQPPGAVNILETVGEEDRWSHLMNLICSLSILPENTLFGCMNNC